MTIDNFQLEDQILEAINNPDGVHTFTPSGRDYPDIKAIFAGINEPQQVIVFQRFNKSQYFSNKRIGIMHTGDTLKEVEGFGMTIGNGVDCAIKNGKLYFKSYNNARQVFDLGMYYRIASETELTSFVDNEKLYVPNRETFKGEADEWTRKKIALIQDSGVLEQKTIEEIAATSQELGVTLEIIDDRIALPDVKKEMKEVLRVLDEDMFKGVFSNNTYETNSKRRR